jgi:hypothetical protein
MADDIIIVNQPLKKRTSKSGKVRFTVEMRSEPLIFNLDPKILEETVAKSIAEELRTQVKGISTSAAPATLRSRAVERKAYAAGKSWATKRFSGGKTGPTPPTTNTAAFNNSGRFAQSIVAMANYGKWTINFAANRLDPSTGNVDRIWARLVQFVPAFADVTKLYESARVRQTMERALGALMTKGEKTHDELSVSRARNLLSLGVQLILKAVA